MLLLTNDINIRNLYTSLTKFTECHTSHTNVSTPLELQKRLNAVRGERSDINGIIFVVACYDWSMETRGNGKFDKDWTWRL